MNGSLQVRGDLGKWVATTANNSLAVNQSLLSWSCFVQFNSFAGTGNTPFIFPRVHFNHGFSLQANGFSQIAMFLGGANAVIQYGLPIVFGESYHIAGSLNATGTSKIYVNGQVVASGSLNIGTTGREHRGRSYRRLGVCGLVEFPAQRCRDLERNRAAKLGYHQPSRP